MKKLFSFLFSVVICISILAQPKPRYSQADKVIIQTFNDSLKAIYKRIAALTPSNPVIEIPVTSNVDIVYKQNFESIPTGLYTRLNLQKTFKTGFTNGA